MGATTEQGEAARRAAAERMCTAVTLELGVMRRELLDARREAEAQRKEVAVGLVKARELEAEVGVREEAARASRKSEDWLRVRNAELQAALDEAQRERARLQVEAAERPLRLVPHTPYTPGVERKKMVAGAFSTPVIDQYLGGLLCCNATSSMHPAADRFHIASCWPGSPGSLPPSSPLSLLVYEL